CFPRPSSEFAAKRAMSDSTEGSSILIVGMGGLGTPAAIALARVGAPRLILIDPDPVELSNLPRQVLYREVDIGAPKVEVAGRRRGRELPRRWDYRSRRRRDRRGAGGRSAALDQRRGTRTGRHDAYL